jgi:hypothetical protein
MEITAGPGVALGVNGAHVGLTWENGVPGKWRLRRQDPGLRQLIRLDRMEALP